MVSDLGERKDIQTQKNTRLVLAPFSHLVLCQDPTGPESLLIKKGGGGGAEFFRNFLHNVLLSTGLLGVGCTETEKHGSHPYIKFLTVIRVSHIPIERGGSLVQCMPSGQCMSGSGVAALRVVRGKGCIAICYRLEPD
jgi:hypothetical protein